MIFAIFAITVYVCLDILNLIEVPEKYSVEKWLEDKSKDIEIDVDIENVVENTTKKVWVDNENENTASNVTAPVVGNYSSQAEENEVAQNEYQTAF